MIWVGGSQSRQAGVADRDHSRLYDRAVVATLDARTGAWTHRLSWRSDRYPGLGQVFKGVSWDGHQLLLCAERELVWVDPSTWQVTRSLSLPSFNDLHHALRWRGDLWVASTGADRVVHIRGEHEVAAFGPEGPVSLPKSDLRQLDLRPHGLHPNHLFVSDERLFCTALMPRTAFEVASSVSYEAGDQPVHDGVCHRNAVWFTSVDGAVHRCESGARTRRELRDIPGRPSPLGWCRGLHFADDFAAVGFTRIRATRWRANLAWMRGKIRGAQVATSHITRVNVYNTHDWGIRGSYPCEDVGLSAVFGVVARAPEE